MTAIEPLLRPGWPPPLDLPGGVRFEPPFVLAPMEGVTHRVFRDLILDLGGPGAAWTEFLRVSQQPVPARRIRRELGPPRQDVPVGVQLMGTEPGPLAATAREAVAAGAPMVDLNFGCPAPRVFNKCAGSALLDDPARIAALVGAVASAVPVPVTAKVRLGTRDASRLAEIVAAVTDGGAALLTVHARTRDDHYRHPARWDELARVRAMTRLPVIGNGDVFSVADAAAMVARCGVDGVMVGRGVLRDPWLLARLRAAWRGEAQPEPGPDRLLGLYARYRDDMLAAGGATDLGVLGQLKQLCRYLEVGVAIGPEERPRLLRAATIAQLDRLLHELAGRAGPAPAVSAGAP